VDEKASSRKRVTVIVECELMGDMDSVNKDTYDGYTRHCPACQSRHRTGSELGGDLPSCIWLPDPPLSSVVEEKRLIRVRSELSQ